MVKFVYESRLPVPPQAVFAFHERPDILDLLSPPWPRVHVVSRTGGLRVGARVEFRIHLGPFYLTWVAVHTEYEHNRLFVDEQQKGPFRYWRHRHLFLPGGDGCLLRDEVTFDTFAIASPLVRKQLHKMFHFRHAVTARELAANGVK